VLQWIIQRCDGVGEARETPIGFLPRPSALDLEGLELSRATADELLSVDPLQWGGALESQQQFLQKFGERMPREMWDEHHALAKRLASRVQTP
jgi:phosphoenolpyruvate carboxykinase (GTP)